jgi:hypothetical protein
MVTRIGEQTIMAKLLSNREMELFNMAVNLTVELDIICGSVSPFAVVRKTVVKKVAAKLSFDIDEDDIEEISQEIGI